jgi:hypothetical protein
MNYLIEKYNDISNIKFLRLDERKKNTQLCINYIKNTLNIITNNDTYSAYILIIFHYIFIIFIIYYLFFGKINLIFCLSVISMIIIFIGHFYFNGCIFIRTEKQLLNYDKWYGIWGILFIPLNNIGVDINSKLTSNIFICYGIAFVLIFFMRILFFI